MKFSQPLLLTLALTLCGAPPAASETTPKPAVSLAAARKAALAAVPGGTVKSGEYEREGGRWIYSFDIATADGTREVWVDPQNGKVTRNEAETKKQEKDEAAHDKLAPPQSPAASAPAPGKSFQVTQRFKAGGDGRWDLLTLDPAGKRLFISRADHVQVLDAASGKPLGEIPDTPGVHAIALAPEAGHGYTSNGRANTLTVFDPATLQKTGEIKVTGENPDVLLYDPFTRRLFAFNGRSANATVVNTETGAVEATLPLEGKPELAVSDGKGRIFVNLEDKNAISVIDAKTLKVTASWPLAPGEEPTGLALDVAHGRLFSACANKKMIVLDAATGRKVAELPIGEGPDGAAFDPGTGMAFSSNGDGTLTVIHEDDPEHFRGVANVPTQKSARTVALDPATHRLYLPAAEFGPAPAATAEQPRPRPPLLPGSFTVLVVEQK